MAGRNFLFVPGPTNTPDRILRAMHIAMEDHRSSSFPSLAAPVLEDLKKIFKTTKGQAYIFPASGTGAWEAALSNTLSPGDRVLAARFGMFSHLWIDMAQRLGLQVDVLDAEWGEGAPIERYQEALAADKSHEIKAVLFTHNETATGVTSDVAGDAEGAQRRQASRAAHGRRRELDRQHRLPDGRVGRGLRGHGIAEGPHAAGRPRHPGREPEGGGALRLGQAAARVLRPRRHEEGQRHRLFPLHAVAAHAVRLARVARDAVRGRPRQRLRAPSSPGRGHPRGHQGVGPRALRPAAQVELGHRQRHHGPGRTSTRRR